MKKSILINPYALSQSVRETSNTESTKAQNYKNSFVHGLLLSALWCSCVNAIYGGYDGVRKINNFNTSEGSSGLFEDGDAYEPIVPSEIDIPNLNI